MSIHIGEIIEQRLLQSGITKSEFARRIVKARQNVNDILRRKSVDTELLLAISRALKFDFFQVYVEELNAEYSISEPNTEVLMLQEQVASFERRSSDCENRLAAAQKEIELQNTIIALYKRQLGEETP